METAASYIDWDGPEFEERIRGIRALQSGVGQAARFFGSSHSFDELGHPGGGQSKGDFDDDKTSAVGDWALSH